MGTVKLKSSDEVFQLKISLLGSDPEIWRTIQISSAATLSTLHKAIQSAFDWEDSHLGVVSGNGKYSTLRFFNCAQWPKFSTTYLGFASP